MKEVIVLGGGVSGVSLAYFLSEKGFKVKLYEKTGKLGGLSRSEWIEKWSCWNDIGPHIFHSPDPEITKIWRDLFSDLFKFGDYYSAVLKGKDYEKFYSYPISEEGINNLSAYSDIKFSDEHISTSDQALAKNFREMMIAKVGKDIENMFFRKYPEKLWGIPTNQMRADWAPKRIKINKKIDTFFSGQFVATSRKGAGQIYTRIFDLLQKKNCEIFLNHEVQSFKKEKNLISSLEINQKFIDTKNKYIISTLPVPITSKFFDLEVNLKYRGVHVSNWIINTREFMPRDYGWIYFDDFDIPFTRITDYTKMSPDSISNKYGILTAECPFDPKELKTNIEEDAYLKKIYDSLNSIPWLENKILDCSSSFREPFVYPIREKGYEEQLGFFNSYIGKLCNFWSIGAAGGFEYSDSQILFRKSKDFSDDLYSDCNFETERLISKSEGKKEISKKFSFSFSQNIDLQKKVIIISEIGINHNGNINLAKKLIEESKKSGADFVKFQLYNPEKRAASKIRDAFYNEQADGEGENLKDIFDSCNLNLEDLKELKLFSDNIGINMFLSAFDKESVYKASEISKELIKISSMDLTNIEVWEAATDVFPKIIASTGMSSISEVQRSYDYATTKINENNISLLHCVSSYPMPIADANLSRINQLKNICSRVGYSDHSTTIEVPFTATLLGAEIIEKHFTIDKSLKGPDHIHSATPDEMKKLVDLIKFREEMMTLSNDEIPKIQKMEMMRQKKGYFYNKNLSAGHILIKSDMRLGTPCLGSDTFECYELIGKKLKQSVVMDEPINKEGFDI